MSNDLTPPEDPNQGDSNSASGGLSQGRIQALDIREEMRQSYLTYAMSVIVSRALPDVRDGLKPAQRRILVAMNDLNLGPNSGRVKCAKISGDTSGNYHPHGESVIYPTLVRMGQDWVMREILIDKQGNFGSIAGLGPAAMRYTEARLSSAASEMLDDLDHDTVDYVPTYDQRGEEPVVLPSRFPGLLVNGSQGIAVGMATSIPPHNLSEVADGVQLLIDNPEASIDEIINVLPGPDFPTGGVICGRYGIRQGYLTGRSTLTLRAKVEFDTEKNTDVIVVREIPYLDTRDRLKSKLEALIKEDRVKGISRVVDYTDRKTPSWQVRLHIYLKRDADREVVLNQLYKYSPLQTTVSVILLALVGSRPQTLNIKELLQEFIRHRVTVIRRRTEFLLNEARRRKHTIEGLLIAQIDIDKVIQTIRNSPSRAEAKIRLREIEVPAEMVARALGQDGFEMLVLEIGERENYSLSANQTEAIVSMQLGSLANLERENLQGEHKQLLENIAEHLRLLSDEDNIRAVIREDMDTLKSKFSNPRRTEISDEELGDVDKDELITEEPMVVTISQRGYVKRTPLSIYKAQNRGGKGVKGAKSDEEDPIEHLFVSSTHSYLLFFTNLGKVYWQKVYDLPLQARTAKGRALVNLLRLSDGERVQDCIDVREFDDERSLLMATRKGYIKKTLLSAYSRPMKGGIIAIKLEEDDSLIDVVKVSPGENVVLSTSTGMAIRFSEADARAMGRNSRGVKGVSLSSGDEVVGMVVASSELSLLTVCRNGYGKRTPFGAGVVETEEDDDSSPNSNGNMRYRLQRRGGKGLRDIKTTSRNGPVIGTLAVADGDDVLLMSIQGKIQRIRAADISTIGRNTQGVTIMKMDGGDTLASIARIPEEVVEVEEEGVEALAVSDGENVSADGSVPEVDSSSATDSATDSEDQASNDVPGEPEND
ncbi:DNA gyrase subunit A [Thalassoglobus neptunius]|uniref:DNA topoisomerase (ATP-hydrolyzing) n=1 Tax=Thalassoglobus neptunius TaxID=1938619 RepID=A0A5C5W1F4_9PLAN|nr:DNA gyrase subunit A [Thalassoglobus neptunius]TWT43602.1 DNA gyrase subunit A [Thalassoglobus neptunius]